MIDPAIRKAQLKALKAFGQHSKSFALAGGTALELFYLKHRFSRDLDFFSPKYSLTEIEELVPKLSEAINAPFKLESEFITSDRHAKVRFYTAKIKRTDTVIKIDFVEDVDIIAPKFKKFDGIPVYAIKDIYFQKILTLTGRQLTQDEIGRDKATGRQQTRDIVDIYYLSKNVEALHKFLKNLNRQHQRGVVQWYRSYSRQDLKLEIPDLDLYDDKLDASEVIRYLDAETKKFISEVLE